MNRWFRFYTEVLDDPKVQQLAPDLFKAWVNLLCFACKNGGLIDKRNVSFALRETFHETEDVVSRLVEAILLDEIEPGFFTPHGWKNRQYQSDSSTKRVKRFRGRFKTVTVTPPDTEQNRYKKDGSDDPLPDKNTAEKELFDRGKAILGQNAGGLIRKVLKAKGENVALARAAIEQASTKQSPLEYAGRIAAGPSDNSPPDIREREKQAVGFYAKLGTPEQKAWEYFRGKAVRDRDGGWVYPSQWPPK